MQIRQFVFNLAPMYLHRAPQKERRLERRLPFTHPLPLGGPIRTIESHRKALAMTLAHN